MATERYAVIVESATHDDLRRGEMATHYSKVVVLAESDTEATLLAAQMVGCHRMPTRTTVTHIEETDP